MTRNILKRMDKIEAQRSPPREKYLWCEPGEDTSAVVKAHLTTHPEDADYRFTVFSWA